MEQNQNLKFKLLSTAVLVGVGGLMSCEQNPLAQYDNSVQNAVPEDVKDDLSNKPKPVSPTEVDAISRDVLILTSKPEQLVFRENQEGTVTFEGRVVDYNFPYDIQIENLPSGASFDARTGTMRWKPDREYNQGVSVAVSNLRVKMSTKSDPVLVITREIPLIVLRR